MKIDCGWSILTLVTSGPDFIARAVFYLDSHKLPVWHSWKSSPRGSLAKPPEKAPEPQPTEGIDWKEAFISGVLCWFCSQARLISGLSVGQLAHKSLLGGPRQGKLQRQWGESTQLGTRDSESSSFRRKSEGQGGNLKMRSPRRKAWHIIPDSWLSWSILLWILVNSKH